MNLRKRLENSTVLAALLSWILAVYVWFCFVTTRWQVKGLNDLAADLKKGPVIYILWHGRVVYGPSAWPGNLGQLFTLMDPSPIGRVASRTQAILGMKPIAMNESTSNFAASRKVLRVARDGHSIGIAADGPRGPGRDAKQAAIEWARATGCPVYMFAWSAKRSVGLNTWDNMIMPVPFTRGAYVYRKWQTDVPRKVDAAGYTALRRKLSDDLDLVTAEADALGRKN